MNVFLSPTSQSAQKLPPAPRDSSCSTPRTKIPAPPAAPPCLPCTTRKSPRAAHPPNPPAAISPDDATTSTPVSPTPPAALPRPSPSDAPKAATAQSANAAPRQSLKTGPRTASPPMDPLSSYFDNCRNIEALQPFFPGNPPYSPRILSLCTSFLRNGLLFRF